MIQTKPIDFLFFAKKTSLFLNNIKTQNTREFCKEQNKKTKGSRGASKHLNEVDILQRLCCVQDYKPRDTT